MAIVGSNLESKEIGLSIGLSGTYYNTEIDAVTGYLKLKTVDTDAQGNPIYEEEGYWISDVINLGDKFGDFDKVFTTEILNGVSSLSVLTRVSDNGYDWSVWTPVAMDGTIQSDTKQYIQVKINLYAGFVNDIFIINKNEYTENNRFLETKIESEASYVIPKLTSNTSSSEGYAFSSSQYNGNYSAWYAFDKADRSEGFVTASGSISGFLGFCFYSKKRVTKYKIRSMSSNSLVNSMPKKWVFQGSNNTTNGTDGTWVDLDTRENQSWATGNLDKEYEVKRPNNYNAYRLKFTENNGHSSYTGLGEMDFYEDGITTMSLKRKYDYDMTLDSTWSEEGSLHRQKVTRDEWLRIDKMNVLRVVE